MHKAKIRNAIKTALLDHGVSMEIISGKDLDARVNALSGDSPPEKDAR